MSALSSGFKPLARIQPVAYGSGAVAQMLWAITTLYICRVMQQGPASGYLWIILHNLAAAWRNSYSGWIRSKLYQLTADYKS